MDRFEIEVQLINFDISNVSFTVDDKAQIQEPGIGKPVTIKILDNEFSELPFVFPKNIRGSAAIGSNR